MSYVRKNYFKGNTPARNRRIKAIHKKFLAHQATWALKRLVRVAALRKKYR